MSEKSTVCHLTSAHSDGDIRIFRKLAISSAEIQDLLYFPNAKSRLEEECTCNWFPLHSIKVDENDPYCEYRSRRSHKGSSRYLSSSRSRIIKNS